MYSGTKFNWIDQSQLDTSTTTVESYDDRTLFYSMITSDKGTEALTRIYGDDFYKMFGRDLSFAKHGQTLLQAKKIIDAGGELLVKRFVADDATLSNIIIVAKVSDIATQRTDENGNLLYVDATTGDETTTPDGNLALEDHSAMIKYELQSIAGAKTYNDVLEAAEAIYDDANGVYPLIVATDVGRNSYSKRLAITADYDSSKTLQFMMYRFYEYENTTTEENVNITMNPDIIYRGTSYALDKYSMNQLYLGKVDDAYEAYAKKLADLSGNSYDTLINMDLIFGCNLKGIPLTNIAIDAEGTDLSYEYGIELQNGSDGTGFGEIPKESTAVATKMVNFLAGQETDEIFDLDVHKIAVILDANYPLIVKEAIASFVNFREDCVYLRDYGTGLTTFAEIRDFESKLTESKFVADYMTSYKVIDPFTSKRIEVTMLYDMVEPIIAMFQSNPASPLAGEINGFTISSAIPGTVNYIPRITPSVNQKSELEDIKVNYATYYEYNGSLVVDSLYTSQDAYTQLSFLCNVIAIQTVMRAIRENCPKNRFKFASGSDFSEYSEAVDGILSNFKSYFSTLTLVYTEDDVKASQKIYYAGIKFAFNNWFQTEIFDLYAINETSEE